MIRTSQVHHCRACGSTHIVKNGRNRSGSQQYQCRTAGRARCCFPSNATARSARPRCCEPIRSVPCCRDSVHLRDHAQNDHAVVKKNSWACPPSRKPCSRPRPVMSSNSTRPGRSCGGARTSAGSGRCYARTRQIVAFANGDHSEATCRALWERVPEAYRKYRSFSDF